MAVKRDKFLEKAAFIIKAAGDEFAGTLADAIRTAATQADPVEFAFKVEITKGAKAATYEFEVKRKPGSIKSSKQEITLRDGPLIDEMEVQKRKTEKKNAPGTAVAVVEKPGKPKVVKQK